MKHEAYARQGQREELRERWQIRHKGKPIGAVMFGYASFAEAAREAQRMGLAKVTSFGPPVIMWWNKRGDNYTIEKVGATDAKS